MEDSEQQNFCCICLNKDLLCSSERVVIDTEILKLLKFLIVNVKIETLENAVVGMGCLEKIADAGEYKYKNLKVSSKILKAKMLKLKSKERICQKCEIVLKRNDAFHLVDCVTNIDWSDFVSYLFKNPDLEYLESSHICDSCRKCVMNIQDILKLLFVYDQSKMQFNCNDTNAPDNKHSEENETEVKKEIESNDVNLLDNLVQNDHMEISINDDDDDDENNDNLNYEDFKLMNEDVDLKFESSDTDESTHGYENVDTDKEISNDDSYSNSADEEEEQEAIYLEVNDLETVKKSNYLECDVDRITNQTKQHEMCRSRNSVDRNTENKIGNGGEFRHIFSAKKLIIKLNVDDRIAKMMQHRLKRKRGWTTPERLICRQHFADYYNKTASSIYPSLRAMREAINTIPELKGKTVENLRSHLQYDFKYVKRNAT